MRLVASLLIILNACQHHTSLTELPSGSDEPGPATMENAGFVVSETAASYDSPYGECPGDHALDLSNENLDLEKYEGGTLFNYIVYKHTLTDHKKHYVECAAEWGCKSPNVTLSFFAVQDTPLCVDLARCCDVGMVTK